MAAPIRDVLIVTSDSKIGDTFSKILEREKFEFEIIPSGEKALEKIWQKPPTLILLNLNLEGMSGLDLLRITRHDLRSRTIPIVAFSTQVNQASILTAFNFEVDDYLSEPFHPDEVIARIKAVLIRKYSDYYQDSDMLKKGKIFVYPSRHQVFSDGIEVKLTPKEYELLLLFLRKEGRVLSRTYLFEAVMGVSKDVNSRSVDMLVARLRKKLKREGERWIETVPGYGYRIASS